MKSEYGEKISIYKRNLKRDRSIELPSKQLEREIKLLNDAIVQVHNGTHPKFLAGISGPKLMYNEIVQFAQILLLYKIRMARNLYLKEEASIMEKYERNKEKLRDAMLESIEKFQTKLLEDHKALDANCRDFALDLTKEMNTRMMRSISSKPNKEMREKRRRMNKGTSLNAGLSTAELYQDLNEIRDTIKQAKKKI